MASPSQSTLPEFQKKENRSWFPSHRKRTLWSYYFEGDVEIPEICIDSLFLCCPDEAKGCSRLHAKKRWQWQILNNNVWFNLLESQSDTLERSFQFVDKDEVVLEYLDPLKTGRLRDELMKLLGNDCWRADFIQMKIFRVNGFDNYCLRRLSTPSSGKCKLKHASEFKWYMQEEDTWVEFGQCVVPTTENSDGWSTTRLSTTSSEIEKQFQKNDSRLMTVNVSDSKARIDFVKMVLIFKKPRRVVPLRRRPKNEDVVYPTMWSHYTTGNIEVPEICTNTVGENCIVRNGCGSLHGNVQWHWQFMHDGLWYNFPKVQKVAFEKAYLDVWKDSADMPAINPQRLSLNYGTIMKELLGTTNWLADFDNMTITKLHRPGTSLKIRRLTTPSTFRSRAENAREFTWFFKNKNGSWVEFGCNENEGETSSLSPLTSSYDIEKCYESKNWDTMEVLVTDGAFDLDFSSMTLRGKNAEENMKVRRRPQCARSDHIHLRLKNRITLDINSKEYSLVRSFLHLSIELPEIISVKRVQDPHLWTRFRRRQEEIASAHGTDEVLNMRTLFHWVEVDVVDDICSNQFGWKHQCKEVQEVCKSKGVAFFRSAKFLHGSCGSPSEKDHRLLVFKVLVGKMNPEEVEPPPGKCSSAVDNEYVPNRFIKYNNKDYCLEYIIEL